MSKETISIVINIITSAITGIWLMAYFLHLEFEVFNTGHEWYGFPCFITTILLSVGIAVLVGRWVSKLYGRIFR